MMGAKRALVKNGHVPLVSQRTNIAPSYHNVAEELLHYLQVAPMETMPPNSGTSMEMASIYRA
jgi:hypothetical protein